MFMLFLVSLFGLAMAEPNLFYSVNDSLDFDKYHVTIDQDGRGPNHYGTLTPKYGQCLNFQNCYDCTMNGCYWSPRKGAPQGNLDGSLGHEGGDYDGSCLFSNQANGQLENAVNSGMLGSENIKFSTTINQVFQNGLQCRDELKFCKESGQIPIDDNHNKTTYEWNTDKLNQTYTIPINYFCIWNVHQNDQPISVKILQTHDEWLGGDKQLVFGNANNTEKWEDPNTKVFDQPTKDCKGWPNYILSDDDCKRNDLSLSGIEYKMDHAKKVRIGFVNTLASRDQNNVFKLTIERSVPNTKSWDQLSRKQKAETPFGMWILTFASTIVIFMLCMCCSRFCKPKERKIDQEEEEDSLMN